jgi:hypothetical protein
VFQRNTSQLTTSHQQKVTVAQQLVETRACVTTLFQTVTNKKQYASENYHSQILKYLGKVSFRTGGV